MFKCQEKFQGTSTLTSCQIEAQLGVAVNCNKLQARLGAVWSDTGAEGAGGSCASAWHRALEHASTLERSRAALSVRRVELKRYLRRHRTEYSLTYQNRKMQIYAVRLSRVLTAPAGAPRFIKCNLARIIASPLHIHI